MVLRIPIKFSADYFQSPVFVKAIFHAIIDMAVKDTFQFLINRRGIYLFLNWNNIMKKEKRVFIDSSIKSIIWIILFYKNKTNKKLTGGKHVSKRNR
ncbi:hypothetical protein CUJ83_02325 [Methanocella sp. CWC-04]|uniref:Uncharacterized protein n=1 Tax=Methanooceanicella nereidis TaxID=2052831 RepID=A0AAP2W516_9EURY|nr:hypothetical protein [Methanocella sp. CWC-04]